MKQNKDLNVWVIPSFYPTTDHPLRGIFFKEQAEAIAKHVKNITVLYPELRSLKELTFKKIITFHFQNIRYIEKNLIVQRKHRWNILPTKSNLSIGQKIWINEVVKMAKRLIAEGNVPDIIHAHCAIGAGFASMKLLQRFNIPYIITEHSTVFDTNLSFTLKKQLENTFSNASKCITVSNSLKSIIQMKVSNNLKIDVIPNFIDTNFFNLSSKKKEDQKFTFLTVSNLIPRKNIDRLIRAFNDVVKENLNANLIIVGAGSEYKNLNDLVIKLKISDKVFFKGELMRQEVKLLMQTASCFVLVSEFETFGVVLIEALSCGIPVIATKSGGTQDIVGSNCGFLINKDETSLIHAMKKIMHDNSFKDVEIRNHALKYFSSDVVSLKYVQVYEEVVNASLQRSGLI